MLVSRLRGAWGRGETIGHMDHSRDYAGAHNRPVGRVGLPTAICCPLACAGGTCSANSTCRAHGDVGAICTGEPPNRLCECSRGYTVPRCALGRPGRMTTQGHTEGALAGTRGSLTSMSVCGHKALQQRAQNEWRRQHDSTTPPYKESGKASSQLGLTMRPACGSALVPAAGTCTMAADCQSNGDLLAACVGTAPNMRCACDPTYFGGELCTFSLLRTARRVHPPCAQGREIDQDGSRSRACWQGFT